jgi:hypothetical protein
MHTSDDSGCRLCRGYNSEAARREQPLDASQGERENLSEAKLTFNLRARDQFENMAALPSLRACAMWSPPGRKVSAATRIRRGIVGVFAVVLGCATAPVSRVTSREPSPGRVGLPA